MEALIKKRIEEAAKEEREQCREDNNEIWRDRPTYNDVEASFIKGATFANASQNTVSKQMQTRCFTR